MNAPLKFPLQIIGLDTSRCPVLLLVTSPNEKEPGAVVPDDEAAFERLEDFSNYWNLHWRDSGVRVAVPDGFKDPLRIRDWLRSIGQPLESYEWLGFQSHLRTDMTLENVGVANAYRRPYVLAVYACHRLHAGSVVVDLWAKLLEICSMLEEARHSVHRLAASLQEPRDTALAVPF